ncbi:MAG: arsenite methyltransferase [Verrucomicrobia bacterium]|nr:arsenite methyltransferase [Verrucomicrobiota bacterium]
MNTMTTNPTAWEQDTIKSAVRQRYGQVATNAASGCGCAPSCCGTDTATGTAATSPAALAQRLGYSPSDTTAAPDGSNLGLGCGNPVGLASLKPGQTVLDLGSGAGFDAFLAAKAVGPTGRVIGVDMTPEMISKARAHQAKGDYAHVEFRLGEIESLPVADGTVDVILSNCVINLSPDKGRVFREAFRVLKPGGRLAISDIVALAPIPEVQRGNWELYTGCVAGAAEVSEVKRWLAEAGFEDIRVEPKARSRAVLQEWFPGQGLENAVASATIQAVKPDR